MHLLDLLNFDIVMNKAKMFKIVLYNQLRNSKTDGTPGGVMVALAYMHLST